MGKATARFYSIGCGDSPNEREGDARRSGTESRGKLFGDQRAELFASKRTLPGFILLYTSIDILASLTRPETSEATSGGFFKDWVANYMLPQLGVVSADDLWGARCGWLHTLMAESDMSRDRGRKHGFFARSRR